jgi:oligopeptide/dipeptide ABC transporter ATP-binding protein
VLSVRDLSKQFRRRTAVLSAAARRLRGLPPPALQAVRQVSFDLHRGETLGLVGESGCGKTTLGRSLLRLVEPDAGQVLFRGVDLVGLSRPDLRRLRPGMQIIFQDPASALNPRHRVGEGIARALEVAGVPRRERRERVRDALEAVGLTPDAAHRFPHQLSGGQRQRVCIGRALATGPDFVVADEPVSSLDVSIQAQILNLLADLQAERGTSMLFISHDLSVVREISRRMAVMYAGTIVELGPSDELVQSPLHPYTRTLLAALPRLHGGHLLNGEMPGGGQRAPRAPLSDATAAPGCPFFARCDMAVAEPCANQWPELREIEPGRWVACHRAEQV